MKCAAEQAEVWAARFIALTPAAVQAKGWKLDYDRWHAAVHGTLPYTQEMRRDPGLAAALKSIPLLKWVFTNGDIKHAETCLRHLGLDQGIFAVRQQQCCPTARGQQ